MEITISIGKAGITRGVVEIIKRELKKKRDVRVRFLPSSRTKTKEELAEELISLVGKKGKRVGFVVMFKPEV